MLALDKNHIPQPPLRPGVTLSLLSGQCYVIINMMGQLPGNFLQGDSTPHHLAKGCGWWATNLSFIWLPGVGFYDWSSGLPLR